MSLPLFPIVAGVGTPTPANPRSITPFSGDIDEIGRTAAKLAEWTEQGKTGVGVPTPATVRLNEHTRPQNLALRSY